MRACRANNRDNKYNIWTETRTDYRRTQTRTTRTRLTSIPLKAFDA